MKKLFFIFVLVSCLAAGFAETGYAGLQWYTHRGDLNIHFEEKTNDDALWETTDFIKKVILGKETVMYYHFFSDYLGAISYTLPLNKTKTFKNQMKEKIYEQQTVSLKKDIWLENFLNQGFFSELKDKDLDLNNIMARFSLDLEFTGYEQLTDFYEKGGKGFITIYNYNNDTRIYLYENFITDSALVVYVPHEQDF